MKKIDANLLLNAVDLRAIDELRFENEAVPVAEIPRVKIRVADCVHEAAIASWRRDVGLEIESSDNLKACILEAKRSGFFYLLADMISIEENSSQLSYQVIEFSKLYKHLRSIISYKADDDLLRPWLRNEALQILNSPTRLGYALGKWQVRTELRPSLLLRQICNRRLGIAGANLSRLKLCDAYVGMHMVLSDLEVTKGLDPNLPFTSIRLDLRRQRYASDILLIFEINREAVREALVERLVHFQSNSVVVPALVGIWACAEGLSVSFRWSDWDSQEILSRLEKIIRQAASSIDSAVAIKKEEKSWRFSLDGNVLGEFIAEIVNFDFLRDLDRGSDLMIRCGGSPLKFADNNAKESFLASNLDFAVYMRDDEHLSEDISELVFQNQSGIIFDDYDHYEDIYDPEESINARDDLSIFVSSERLAIFEQLVRESIIQEHVHFRIDVNKLERAVKEFKLESHRMVLLYLSEASQSTFFLDLAIAISDMWWFTFGDKHLQLICEEIAEAIRNGNNVSVEDVIRVYETRLFGTEL